MDGVVKYTEIEKIVFLRSSLDLNIPYCPSYNSGPTDFTTWMDSIEHDVELVYGFGKHNHIQAEQIFSDISRLESVLKKFQLESPNASNMVSSELTQLTDSLLLIQNNKQMLFGEEKVKSGRRPIPSILANQLLNGLNLSKQQFGNYEYFRTYYHHACNNNFNLGKRSELNRLQTSCCYDISEFDIDKNLGFQLPVAPASKPLDTSWARALKQTLKAAIARQTPYL